MSFLKMKMKMTIEVQLRGQEMSKWGKRSLSCEMDWI